MCSFAYQGVLLDRIHTSYPAYDFVFVNITSNFSRLLLPQDFTTFSDVPINQLAMSEYTVRSADLFVFVSARC